MSAQGWWLVQIVGEGQPRRLFGELLVSNTVLRVSERYGITGGEKHAVTFNMAQVVSWEREATP